MERTTYRGSVVRGTVCFAGSRRGRVGKDVSGLLVRSFSSLGFNFCVGCARGVDGCFRKVLTELVSAGRWTVHCATQAHAQALRQKNLRAVCTVIRAPSIASALHRRTVGMVLKSSLLVLFPDDPSADSWGKGSRLAFDTAVKLHKPVFVVTAISPMETERTRVVASSLFGVVSGYWVVPHDIPVREGAVHA